MRRRLGIKRYCAGMRETCSKYTEESAEAAPGASAPSRTHHPPPGHKSGTGSPPSRPGAHLPGSSATRGLCPASATASEPVAGGGQRREAPTGGTAGTGAGRRAANGRAPPVPGHGGGGARSPPALPHLLSAARRALLPRTCRRGAEGRRKGRRRSELGGG